MVAQLHAAAHALHALLTAQAIATHSKHLQIAWAHLDCSMAKYKVKHQHIRGHFVFWKYLVRQWTGVTKFKFISYVLPFADTSTFVYFILSHSTMYWYWRLQSIIAQAAARSLFQSCLLEVSTSLEPDLSIFCSSVLLFYPRTLHADIICVFHPSHLFPSRGGGYRGNSPIVAWTWFSDVS
jgi:hypothetical protein